MLTIVNGLMSISNICYSYTSEYVYKDIYQNDELLWQGQSHVPSVIFSM